MKIVSTSYSGGSQESDFHSNTNSNKGRGRSGRFSLTHPHIP